MDRGDAVRGPLDRAMARYAVHTIPGTRNIFVPTWVHVKHYGLILGGPFLLLVLFRVFFFFNKSRNHLNEVRNIGYVLFPEKKAPVRNAPVVVLAGSYDNSGMSSQNRRTPSEHPSENKSF